MRLVYLWDESGARLNYDGDITATVSTKAQVLAAIESLLDAGYSNLNSAVDCDSDDENGVQFCFTLSDGFAGFDTPATFANFNRGLRARVAVHQSDWSAAQTALNNCSAWATSSNPDEGVYHTFSTGANDQGNEMYEAADGEYVKLMIHPSHIADAESGDSRVTDNTYIRSEVITYDELESFIAPTLYSNSYDPVPIMRSVELQLLQAEVHIGNGDYSSAESIMNTIRAAAGVTDYSGTDASNAVDRVLHEKRYSLFLEGHRLVDMRHYGKTGELPLDRPGRGDEIVTFPIPETETPG
nr:RagB/SusD family nutrient uptake outer membrane protein [Dehalococcoidia bacterium]